MRDAARSPQAPAPPPEPSVSPPIGSPRPPDNHLHHGVTIVTMRRLRLIAAQNRVTPLVSPCGRGASPLVTRASRGVASTIRRERVAGGAPSYSRAGFPGANRHRGPAGRPVGLRPPSSPHLAFVIPNRVRDLRLRDAALRQAPPLRPAPRSTATRGLAPAAPPPPCHPERSEGSPTPGSGRETGLSLPHRIPGAGALLGAGRPARRSFASAQDDQGRRGPAGRGRFAARGGRASRAPAQAGRPAAPPAAAGAGPATRAAWAPPAGRAAARRRPAPADCAAP